MGSFTADPDRLDHVVDQMTKFGSDLAAALDDVDARITRLHTTWTGDAADQHRRDHDRWRQDIADMQAALTQMCNNAATASTNYRNAVTTNARMWEQLR